MLPMSRTLEHHSQLPQTALQSKAVLLGTRDPCSSVSHRQAWVAGDLKALSECHIYWPRVAGDSPRLWTLLSTQASDSFGNPNTGDAGELHFDA